jgi:hypothetical protein
VPLTFPSVIPRPPSALRRRANRATIALTLLGTVALFWPRRAPADIGDEEGIWYLSPEITVPIGARLTLFGATACDNTLRYCVDYPLIAFGFDVTRPSSPGSRSISLAFAQAPLTGFAALASVFGTRPPALRRAALALAWLGGGMFRWTPGGNGNLHHEGESRSTLSFALKNEIALHPFVSPQYLRVTPGAGVAFTRMGRTRERGIPWGFTCSAGGVASLAAEYGGRSGWRPAVWLSCLLWGE